MNLEISTNCKTTLSNGKLTVTQTEAMDSQ